MCEDLWVCMRRTGVGKYEHCDIVGRKGTDEKGERVGINFTVRLNFSPSS